MPVEPSDALVAEVMAEPGANRSTHVPQFEKLDRTSEEVLAPTVSAVSSEAGVELQASMFSFPAATA